MTPTRSTTALAALLLASVVSEARAGEWIPADVSVVQRTLDPIDPHPRMPFRVCESPEMGEFFAVCQLPDEPSSHLRATAVDELADAGQAGGSASMLELAAGLPGRVSASVGGMAGDFPNDFHGALFADRGRSPVFASIEDGGAFTTVWSSVEPAAGRFEWFFFAGAHRIIGDDGAVWMGLAELRFSPRHARREPELRLGLSAASQRWCPGSGFEGDAGWTLELDRCASRGVNASVDISLLTTPLTRTEFGVLVSHGLFSDAAASGGDDPDAPSLSSGASTSANFEVRTRLGHRLAARIGYSPVRHHESGRSTHTGFAGIQLRF